MPDESKSIISKKDCYNEADLYLIDYFNSYCSAIFFLLPKLKEDRTLIIPVTFLIAHYLELWIKNLIFYSFATPVEDIKGWELDTHDLQKLFKHSVIEDTLYDHKISLKRYNEVIELYEYFDQLKIDGVLSEAMRFPIGLKGNQAKVDMEEIEKINIYEFIEKTTKIVSLTMGIFHDYYMVNIKNLKKKMKAIEKKLTQIKKD